MTLFTLHNDSELIPKMAGEKGTLGAKIAELRKNRKITQEEFAERLGVTAQAVSKWENNVSCPDITLLPKLAQIFGVSIDELMGVKAPEKKNSTVIKPENYSKNKLRIHITDAKGKPIEIKIPVSFAMKAADIGLKISALTGNESLNNVPVDKIAELIKNGVTGEILDLTADDGTHINIEIS